MKDWWRRRRFLKAYKILRNEAERHRRDGHHVWFEAINESHISLTCRGCPYFNDEEPLYKKLL